MATKGDHYSDGPCPREWGIIFYNMVSELHDRTYP